MLPRNESCPWVGIADRPGRRAWTVACDWDITYSHELGHTFGMDHANALGVEYADSSDFMSIGGNFPLNSPHRLQLGWLGGAQVVTVESTGSYELAPLEHGPDLATRPQVIKIRLGDPLEHYYLSYRRAIGLSVGMSAEYVDRLNVHRHRDNTLQPTDLVTTLGDGDTYADVIHPVIIRQLTHADDQASVSITISASAPAAPTNLSATLSCCIARAIELVWSDNSTDETGFVIERSADGFSFGVVGFAPADATGFGTFAPIPDTEFFFRVIAYNTAGYSPPSNVASVRSGPF